MVFYMLSYNVYTIDLIHVLWGWDGSSPSFWNRFTVRWLLITIPDYFAIAFNERRRRNVDKICRRWKLSTRDACGNYVNKLTYKHVEFSDHFYTMALYEVRNWLPKPATPFELMFSLHVRAHFVRFVVRYDYCNIRSSTVPTFRMRGAIPPLPHVCLM